LFCFLFKENAGLTYLQDTEGMTGIASAVEAFKRDGISVIQGFADSEECQGMMNRMVTLIDEWDPSEIEVFRTDGEQIKNQGSSDYFLDSADRIHFFLESRAVDPVTKGLKKGISKHDSMNKVGHGLHVDDPVFGKYSKSKKIAALCHALGWVDPVLPQSMYIFKNAQVGGEVTSHQDSSFLYTTPKQTCLGLWLALQDATLENGCLWARPGSYTYIFHHGFLSLCVSRCRSFCLCILIDDHRVTLRASKETVLS